MDDRKQAILSALDRFVLQRSGLDFANYGDAKAYRSEQRSITKDLHHYRALERYVLLRDSITADALLAAACNAYSGRLTISFKPAGKTVRGVFLPSPVPNAPELATVDYCTGQYFPTEYRRAACAVLAAAIWDYWREQCMPTADAWRVECYSDNCLERIPATRKVFASRADADAYAATVAKGRHASVQEYMRDKTPGAWLRHNAVREFGRSIASRWFN